MFHYFLREMLIKQKNFYSSGQKISFTSNSYTSEFSFCHLKSVQILETAAKIYIQYLKLIYLWKMKERKKKVLNSPNLSKNLLVSDSAPGSWIEVFAPKSNK